MVMSLRLPPEVHEFASAAAKKDERSLNAQIVYVLRRWMEEQRTTRAPEDGER